MEELTSHIDEIKTLCSQHHVNTLFAFGSVVRDALRAESDIDLIVYIDNNDPFDYSDSYFASKLQLEDIFKRHVDLLEAKAL